MMENRAFDHILGCMLSGRPGVDSASNANSSALNVSCGNVKYVCEGGGPNRFSEWNGHFCGCNDSANAHTSCSNSTPAVYPYGKQSDACDMPRYEHQAFSAEQLPVKRAIVEHYGVFNKYFASVPVSKFRPRTILFPPAIIY